jgi:3-oxoacyl-[acyl-carrier-protein] synthase III
MENNNLIFYILEETAQDFLESNIGRRLTSLEINRMTIAVFESLTIVHSAADIMYEAAREAIDNTEGKWDEVDKDFLAGNSTIHKLDV